MTFKGTSDLLGDSGRGETVSLAAGFAGGSPSYTHALRELLHEAQGLPASHRYPPNLRSAQFRSVKWVIIGTEERSNLLSRAEGKKGNSVSIGRLISLRTIIGRRQNKRVRTGKEGKPRP
jgi:hypothetical protein